MRPLLLACVIASSACGALNEISSGTLYHPPRSGGAGAPEPSGLERWWLERGDGVRVEAWYLPPDPPRDGPGPAVVFAHGGAEQIDPWAEELTPYREMGLAVLLPEYRGYGRSGGEPGEAAILSDFSAFYDRLVDRPEIDGRHIVFHGRSLGGGVVGVLSARRRCAALVLESTFTNVPDLASRWMVPAGAIRDRYDTRAVLLGSSTPTLIIHGVDDALIPFEHAAELDRVAWDSRLLALHAGHEDVPRGDAYWRAIRELLLSAGVLADES